MKIVIDIPKSFYETLKKVDETVIVSGQRSGKTLMSVIYNAIINGVPLPKGHGDLIDRSELLMEVREVDCDAAPGGYDYILDKQDVLDAPIIIEADTESEE